MRTAKYFLVIILLCIAWTVIIYFTVNTGIYYSPITSEDSPAAFIEATEAKLEKEFVGNLAMVLLDDGKVSDEFYHSVDAPIDKHSIFQMASVSKWVTAWGVWALVEEGALELDRPVENYLTRWHLPESEFDNNEVTIRNLLSHTSGLTDGLGYAGFGSPDSVQTLEESLTKAADAFATDGVVRVGNKPNSVYKYSGGGYTLLQLVIEEVSGQSFDAYMREAVFEPLRMKNSSFHWKDSSSLRLATFYEMDSSISPHYRYTALAAASLYTNIEDMVLFLNANFTKNSVLSQETIKEMVEGFGSHGMGPMIFGKKGTGDWVIGHDGISRPAINTAARINLKTNDGIIVLETGSWSFASELADEWVYWKTEIPNGTVMESNMTRILTFMMIGYVVIILSSLILIRKRSRKA